MIADNIIKVNENIEKACARSNRNPNDVKLIAVSKTKPIELLKEALDCQIIDFGENKVQELCDKHEFLPKNINWHFIGHLQRNKVKYIVGKVALIHSMDSVRLARQIELESAKLNIVTNILVQVNVSNEDTKFGIHIDETEDFIKELSKFPHIQVKGLMTIAPYTNNAESNRKYFAELYKVYVDINSKNIDNVTMNMLSMGMTGDYEVAIEEGSTMVRVGTGIFGERIYNG